MKKSFKVLPLICWVAAIFVTALVYWLLTDDLFSSSVKMMSVCFVLLSEASLCAKFMTKKQSIILNVQTIFGIFYLFAMFLLSLVYLKTADPNIKLFFAIHIVLLLLLTIADVAVLYAHNRASQSDSLLAKNQSVMSACSALVHEMIAANEESQFKKELMSLSELIKYADHSVLSGDEGDLTEALEGLKGALASDADEENIKKQIQDIKALLKVRDIYIKQQQRGKF